MPIKMKHTGHGSGPVEAISSWSGHNSGVDPGMKKRGNCMFLSAETECSSGALRFSAGEKKLVIAGCLRSPWFTVIHA